MNAFKAAVSLRCPRTVWLLAGLLPALVPADARANDRDLRGTTVSAMSCIETIRRNVAGDPWFIGFVQLTTPDSALALRCPFPLNDIDLSGTTNDNDLSKIRVHYADRDGRGINTDVKVVLWRVVVNPGSSNELVQTNVCQWNSSTNGTGATTVVYSTKSCAHDLSANAFYYFQVNLFNSSSSSTSAIFVGIDFPL